MWAFESMSDVAKREQAEENDGAEALNKGG